VLIESPEDGDRYNAAGGGSYTADADPGSPTACDAAFSIACSELGADVELFHDGASTPFATAPCEEPAAGDPAVPDGYAGRAVATALFDDGDGTSVIVARQAIEASSTQELVGTSAAITVQGDCLLPSLTLSGDPCGEATGNQLSAAQAAARDVDVGEGTTDAASATLAFSNTDGTTGTLPPTSSTSEVRALSRSPSPSWTTSTTAHRPRAAR
jgi:hypothetical protein